MNTNLETKTQEELVPEFKQAEYSVYARADTKGRVVHIFSTCFETPEEGDVLIKTGSGDEYVHVAYYQLYTAEMAHQYVIENGAMREATAEEIAAELAEFPAPPETDVEKIARVEEELTQTQLALTEQYEQNLALGEEITNTQIALTEVYEGLGV